MRSIHLLVSALVLASSVGACSASKKTTTKKASGTASKSTKAAPSKPTPSKKAGSNVSSNVAASLPEGECTAEENGLGACVDSFVVFCSDAKLYSLNCAEAFAGSTCAEIEGEIDCVVTTEE